MTDPKAAPESLDAMIRAFSAARTQYEAADKRSKELHRVADELAIVLFDAMERLSLRSVRHELGTFSLNDLAWASIKDRDAALAWANAEMPELVTLNNQRLSVYIREWIRGEHPDPIPGVDFTASRGINWRRPQE